MRRWSRQLLPALVCLLALSAMPAAGFNPPVDTAGPLRVSIDAPQQITAVDTPARVRVVLENQGDGPIEGTLRLGVIDRFRAEPAEPVAFRLDPGKKATYAFSVSAGTGSFSALYPIHAWARFAAHGKQLEAHPVAIVETRLPRREIPRRPILWEALDVPKNGELALWQSEVCRTAVQVFDKQADVLPVGWTGSEPAARASFSREAVRLGGQSREAVVLHPPWFDGQAGTIVVEWPLKLPEIQPLRLRTGLGMGADGPTDGVTFRVRVAGFDAQPGTWGEIVYQRHTDARTWQDVEVDLSRFAGRTIRLQLESHPGPNRNTGWDRSCWAEPTLLAGTPPEPVPFPPKSLEGSRRLGEAGPGALYSQMAKEYRATRTPVPRSIAALARDTYEVRYWPGRRGLLDGVIGLINGQQRLYFHGFEVRVDGKRLDHPGCPWVLEEVYENPREQERGIPPGLLISHEFSGPRGRLVLFGELRVDYGVLRVEFSLADAPRNEAWHVVRIEEVALGPWSHQVRQVYAGAGNVVRDPRAFHLGFDGHRLSTSFVGLDFDNAFSIVHGVDIPPDGLEIRPQDRHYSIHTPGRCELSIIPAADAFEGATAWREANGLWPAGGVPRLAGRFVFDLWGGRYAESAEALERAFRYGLTDSLVVWHNWQRYGYDYRLPDIYPPNPQWGTLEDFQHLAEVCCKAGVLFAPHDNYIDFYPDAEGFSYENVIAFDSSGQPVRAWFNRGREAQSYRYRADQVGPFLMRNVRLLRENVHPTAYFIDVWSSIRPYEYWTADGKFFDRVRTRDEWKMWFGFIRDYLGHDAPQISESGHDQLVGRLDGAQTNHLRVGEPPGGYYNWSVWNWRCADAERIPWFDTVYHDRFILHGAGYSGRYQAGLDTKNHGIYSDDYIATEVLTGHPAMVSQPFSRDVVRKYWLTHHLMRALALRWIKSVEFVDDDLHRQHVTWNADGHVWVNRGQTPWKVAGCELPTYGFLARVPIVEDPESSGTGRRGEVEAAIARRNGVIVEWARTPGFLYVNGRMPFDGPNRIALTVRSVRRLADGQLEWQLAWRLDDPLPEGFRPFLHLVDKQGEILAQPAQDLSPFQPGRTGQLETTARALLPAEAARLPTLELRYGFYDPGTGTRLELAGPDDGTRRIRAGTLQSADKQRAAEQPVAGQPESKRPADEGATGDASPQPNAEQPAAQQPVFVAHEAPSDPWLARQNLEGKPVDFGPVVTAGACRMTWNAEGLDLTPLPADKGQPFVVQVKPRELGWQPGTRADARLTVRTISEDGKVLDTLPCRLDESGAFLIECRPGVFCYRVEAAEKP